MSDLTKADEVRALVERAAYYGKSVIADRTRHQYEMEFKHFRAWAESRGLPALPTTVEVVACYLAALADGGVEMHWLDGHGDPKVSRKALKYGSIQHHYQAIIFGMKASGHEWPVAPEAITKVMKGIAHRHGTRKRRMASLEIGDLRKCLAKMRERRFEDLTVHRDRAILSLGFFGAFRRSEIVGLRIEDLEFSHEGLVITIRRSKEDELGASEQIAIVPQRDPNVCPIALLKRYMEISGRTSGFLFSRIDVRSDAMGDRPLTPAVVGTIVKTVAEKAGLDPAKFAGHSLRAGFVTTAAARGVPLHQIMRQTRHKSERVAMTYVRPATLFTNNPSEGLSEEKLQPEACHRCHYVRCVC